MHYTDETLIQNYLQRELSTDEVAMLISAIIPGVDKWINKSLDTRFDKVDATTRLYEGGGNSLDIDACTEISAIKALNDDGTDSYTYTTTTEYIAEPINETVKTELRKRYGCFPRGVNRISVTAKFSEYDGMVPKDIQIAATRICANLLASSTNTGFLVSEELEGHKVVYQSARGGGEIIDKVAFNDPIVSAILDQRREILVG